MFTMADKGNVTVALNKSEYLRKMDTLFSDVTTYKKIKKSPLKYRQHKINKLLKRWNVNEYLNRKYKDHELTQTDTSLPRAYGLAKIHKQNCPFRPVISAEGSPTYFLAQFLYIISSECPGKPKFHVKNSFEFIKKIKNKSISKNHRVISLDVKSLYTNVGKQRFIQALEKRAHLINSRCKIPLNEIIEATELLMDNTSFQFNNKFYTQIFGTPMGSSISGLFADLVMEDLETECLRKLSFAPAFYFRYVDDVITCVPHDKIDEILAMFNTYDDRLQFTYEIENTQNLHFSVDF